MSRIFCPFDLHKAARFFFLRTLNAGHLAAGKLMPFQHDGYRMSVKDSWQEKIFETQARQQKRNTNSEFRQRLYRLQAVQQIASIKLRMSWLAALTAWSFAGMQWLK